MQLVTLLNEQLIRPSLKSKSKLAVLGELAEMISLVDGCVLPESVARALVERERIDSTAIGRGVALPHAHCAAFERVIPALGVSRSGVDFDAPDGELCHIFFAVVVPEGEDGAHRGLLREIALLCQHKRFRRDLLAADNAAAMRELITLAANSIA